MASAVTHNKTEPNFILKRPFWYEQKQQLDCTVRRLWCALRWLPEGARHSLPGSPCPSLLLSPPYGHPASFLRTPQPCPRLPGIFTPSHNYSLAGPPMEVNGLTPILHLGKLRLARLTCSEPQGGESGPVVGTVAGSNYQHSPPSPIPSMCSFPAAEWRPVNLASCSVLSEPLCLTTESNVHGETEAKRRDSPRAQSLFKGI